MYTFYKFLTQISPFLVVPYTVVLLVIIAYFLHKKCKVLAAIKNVPRTTIFAINLSNVKKNKQIKSMIYNFIIVLSMSELIDNIIWGIGNVFIYDIKHADRPINISKSCTMRDGDVLGILSNSYSSIVHHLLNIGLVLTSLLPTIMCMFVIVLRRIYLNAPYRKWVRGYSLFITMRFIVLVALSSNLRTWYISQLLYLPLSCLDGYVFVISSKKFYLLLKGRRDEAKFHLTQNEYRKRVMIVRQYFWGQIITGFVFSLLFLNCILTFVSIPLRITTSNPCYLNYISFSLIPNFKLSHHLYHLATELNNKIYITQLVCVGIMEVTIFSAYLVICIIILIRSFVKCYKFKYVNEWTTRPLMEQYRNDLEKNKGIRAKRPPFIQDIRSNQLF